MFTVCLWPSIVRAQPSYIKRREVFDQGEAAVRDFSLHIDTLVRYTTTQRTSIQAVQPVVEQLTAQVSMCLRCSFMYLEL